MIRPFRTPILFAMSLSLLATVPTSCNKTEDTPTLEAANQARSMGSPPLPPAETLSSRPNAGESERLFVEYCAMCHDDMGMGTGLLARRTDPAKLEEIDYLTKEYVEIAVRMGIGNMPAIPRGELSDENLTKIAEYLQKAE